ncbi:MAG: aspartate aminotransferase family protein [Victivallaceae bacterium]|nr:aspartate aminotransferase family protein [Victivallaceae bacterium]
MNGDLAGQTRELFSEYVMPTYAPLLVFERGEGAYLYDTEKRRYLDFACGISVCNLGHCHPKVTAAICEQAGKLVHVSNLYMNTMMPKLAAKLVSFGFDGKVFFCNSGAEANEGMIKLARKWGNPQGKNRIVCMEDSFHGRTLATLAATGRAKYRKGFEPDVPGFSFVPFNDFDALKTAVGNDVCAVLLEPLQGEGGIIPADLEYLKKVRALCDERNVLLLFDEVQCGIGRMGTLFAHQSFGVKPDAFSMAKALANGFPMGAFMVARKYADTLTVGTHASTFGGTALAAAAALATLGAIEDEHVLDNVNKQSEYLFAGLRRIAAPYAFVKDVRGKGLMIGVVLDVPAAGLQKILFDYDLITLTAGETVLRLLPPLNISREQCDTALAAIEKGLAAFAAQRKEQEK